MRVCSLWRFPIKGLGGRAISQVWLTVDETLPGDRRYALSVSSVKAAQTGDNVWLQKGHFLQLMKNSELALLNCQLEEHKIVIESNGMPTFYGDLGNVNDRLKCQSYISSFLKIDKKTKLRIHHMENGAYTDQARPLVSIGGSASLEAFAAATKTMVDARRFRLNIILKTDEAFVENRWHGSRLKVGETIIEIVDDVGRCSAINVNPTTAVRESDHVATMRQVFGHSYLGIFGRVIKGGALTDSSSAEFLTAD